VPRAHRAGIPNTSFVLRMRWSHSPGV
jgi:hypothetical protein